MAVYDVTDEESDHQTVQTQQDDTRYAFIMEVLKSKVLVLSLPNWVETSL